LRFSERKNHSKKKRLLGPRCLQEPQRELSEPDNLARFRLPNTNVNLTTESLPNRKSGNEHKIISSMKTIRKKN
jgi:hypothetical protein